MTALTEYYLGSRRDVVKLELLEISHPSFTKTYRIVRNARKGITATIDGVPHAFEYYPLRIRQLGSGDDMDQSIGVDLGDLGDILPTEIDAVFADDAATTKPMLRYWAFRSDDLTIPLLGPVVLEITTLAFKREGASFEAHAPYLNRNRTGEVYSLTRFPMLRGTL